MKIDNPDMEKVRKAANTHKKNILKSTTNTSKAFQIKTNSNGNSNSNSNKPITCYTCRETGHKSIEAARGCASTAQGR